MHCNQTVLHVRFLNSLTVKCLFMKHFLSTRYDKFSVTNVSKSTFYQFLSVSQKVLEIAKGGLGYHQSHSHDSGSRPYVYDISYAIHDTMIHEHIKV